MQEFGSGIQVRGDYAYVGAQQTFRVVDISDPTNPVIVGTMLANEVASCLAVTDDFAYLADGSSGLDIIDLNSRTTATGTIVNDDTVGSTAIIGGTVFVDANGNGLFDGGSETGIDGVTIELSDSKGNLLQTVLADRACPVSLGLLANGYSKESIFHLRKAKSIASSSSS